MSVLNECWVVSDGKPGMQNQCLGLAEAVGLPVVVKRISVRWPWTWLLPQMWPSPLAALSPAGDRLTPPWPRLLVGTGRMSVAPAIAVREASGGATFAVQIQDPGVPASRFDLVVAPQHDRIQGPNVMKSMGALHRVTSQRLAAEAATFAPALAALPRPLVAVLVGGNNRSYRFDVATAQKLGEQLRMLVRDGGGGGLAVTVSRRTSAKATDALRRELEGLPVHFWDGAGANPYFGYLGLADAIVVTCDSVSMVSEAASTGKPVYVFDLPGFSRKFNAFHDGLRAAGITRRFDGRLDTWTYVPLSDTSVVAAEVRRRLQLPPLADPVPPSVLQKA